MTKKTIMKTDWLIWFNILVCVLVEYQGVWNHDKYLIFIGGLCALTNFTMLGKKDV